MPYVDYTKLTHRLEAAIDEAIQMLQTVPHLKAQKVREKLIHALLHNEEEIIREYKNVIPFPKSYKIDDNCSSQKDSSVQ